MAGEEEYLKTVGIIHCIWFGKVTARQVISFVV